MDEWINKLYGMFTVEWVSVTAKCDSIGALERWQ